MLRVCLCVLRVGCLRVGLRLRCVRYAMCLRVDLRTLASQIADRMRCHRACIIAVQHRADVNEDRVSIAYSKCIGIAVSRDSGEMLPGIALVGAEHHPFDQ